MVSSIGPFAGGADSLFVEARGQGRRLVLVHGFTQTGRSWHTIVAHLAAHYEVLTVDLPGHGRSSNVEVGSIEDGARLLGNTGGRATYVGYSLGGRTCLALALNAPELVESLVLIGATPGIVDERERVARKKADETLADRLDEKGADGFASLEEFLLSWLAGPMFSHLTAEQADLSPRRENDRAGLAASLRTMGTGTQPAWHKELAALSMPVLVLAGEKDERFATIADEMRSAIGANATIGLIDGAGHAAPFENLTGFLSILETFLAATGSD